jgi:hypothetical protein
MRLYLLVPAMVLSAALVGLRTLNLRLSGQWAIGWSIAAALIVSQLTIGLHYLRLSPLSFGLILLGVLYAITGIAAAVVEERPIRTAWIEPAAMMTTFLVLAVVFRF